MSPRVKDILALKVRDHDLNPPASEHEIRALLHECKFDLPAIYIEFLQVHNGGNGELPVDPCWYELWQADEVIEKNEDYEVANDLPDFLAIGSNQGGELLCIDYREKTKGNIVSIPLIPSDPEYAVIVSQTFEEMIYLLGIECQCDL